jgi:hypothetical protein
MYVTFAWHLSRDCFRPDHTSKYILDFRRLFFGQTQEHCLVLSQLPLTINHGFYAFVSTKFTGSQYKKHDKRKTYFRCRKEHIVAQFQTVGSSVDFLYHFAHYLHDIYI